jgi:hypothetical protein
MARLVGVGQHLLPGLGRRQLLAVPLQDISHGSMVTKQAIKIRNEEQR